MSEPNRGIVLYDFLYCQGGAERLTLELARGLPDADLGFGFRDSAAFPDASLAGIRTFDLEITARFPGGRTLQGMWAFRTRTQFIRNYDWVIYSGSVAPEAVYNHPRNSNIYYCHTIPRFAYDLYSYYRRRLSPWQYPAFKMLNVIVQHRYPRALRRMDLLVANSENVRGRIRRYLGLDARVVHPPCDVEGYRWLGQDDYYLSSARLEPYKRVDTIIKAFLCMPDKKLLVASGGSELGPLKRLAQGAANISFTGWVDDQTLRCLVGRAIATIYIPRDEDFGISPVESMAAGKPVIGTAEGGLLETVVNGETGILLRPDVDVQDLISAVHRLDFRRAVQMRDACAQRSLQFSRDRFLGQMREVIEAR